MQRIAIAGATGTLAAVSPRACSRRATVCAVWCGRPGNSKDATGRLTRASRSGHLIWTISRSLTRDLSGCDVAFYLVHSMMSSDRVYAEHDLALALTFAAAARDAGVGRIVYLGGLGEMGSGLSEHLSRGGMSRPRWHRLACR